MKFHRSDNPILTSINTYRPTLINDTRLSLRLTYHHQTYTTHLVEWKENLVIIEAPLKGVDYVLLPDHSSINATFIGRNGLFCTTFCILKKYTKGNLLYYVAEIITPLVKRQQRQSFRLEVLLDVRYTHPPHKEVSKNNDLPTIIGKGTCLNISTGGMCLACDHQFHSKQLIQMNFRFIDQLLELTGEVLFLGDPVDSVTYHHRIRFINISHSDSELLNKLIFQKQRMELKYQST